MPDMEIDLDSKAVVKGQVEFSLDAVQEALVKLGEKGVPGYADITVNGPTRGATGWAIIARWDPEGREF